MCAGMSTMLGLNQIQFEIFCRFIDKGLREELYKFQKIEDPDQEIEEREREREIVLSHDVRDCLIYLHYSDQEGYFYIKREIGYTNIKTVAVPSRLLFAIIR